MDQISCFAAVDAEKVALLTGVLRTAGAQVPPTIARLNVAELGRLGPSLLVCDVDRLATDQLEMLRQVRFVLPECVIAVYTGHMTSTWARACHIAGANCLLAKKSTKATLAAGLAEAMVSGCFTDPRFVDITTERGAAS
jgi:DNA-binding NarL/FixJ family response regulator